MMNSMVRVITRTMLVTHRHLLRPTRGQRLRLLTLLEEQRQLFNAALEERIDAWRKSKTSITRLDQQKSLTVIRAEDPHGFGASPAQMGRWTLKRLDDAFRAFFDRVKRGAGRAGFPRFRSFSRWRSFGLLEWSGARISNGHIVLKGMGRAIRVNWHRPLPADAVIKGATFTRKGRRWFVSLQIETDSIVARRHGAPNATAGLDVGVESLAIWDDGSEHGFVSNARPRSKRQADLRRAQRALARCRRGSTRRRKVKARLARLQERIADARSTHLHAEAERLARRFSTLCVEKLRISNMTRSAAGTADEPGTNVAAKSGLNAAILDAGWGRFVQFLRYKAARAGGVVLDVDPKRTSQICSGCGTLAPKPLRQREHSCPACGLAIHRDVNAARNIRAQGLAAIAASGGVIAPGERNVGHRPVRAPRTLLAA